MQLHGLGMCVLQQARALGHNNEYAIMRAAHYIMYWRTRRTKTRCLVGGQASNIILTFDLTWLC
jgi:hypothetical protein